MITALQHYRQLPASTTREQVEGKRALQHLQRINIPSQKSEYWRYTSLKPLFNQLFWPSPGLPVALERDEIGRQFLNEEGPRLVFVNGWFAPALSDVHATEGLSLTTIANSGTATGSSRFAPVTADISLFDALNRAQIQDGMLLEIHSNYPSTQTLELVHITTHGTQPRLIQPRHHIHLHADAKLDIIEHQIDRSDSSNFTNAAYEIILDAGAELHQQRLQTSQNQSYTLVDTQVQQATDSVYRYTGVQADGAWIREQFQIGFTQPGARCDLNGLSLVGNTQLRDYHIDIQHRVPQCTSRSGFKGIMLGKGRGVFDGRILVEKQAQQTDAYLSNANLVLTEGAEIDSKPQLEIFADDVQCGHGSSIGQLDQDMLFYMQSRGIPSALASTMLCHGFALDVLQKFTHTGLQARAMQCLSQQLSATT